MAFVEGLKTHQDNNINDNSRIEFPGNRCLAAEPKVFTVIGQKAFRCLESEFSDAKLGLSHEPSPEPLHIFILGPSICGKRQLLESFTGCNLEIPTDKNAYLAHKLKDLLLQGIEVEIYLWHVGKVEGSLSILQIFFQKFKTCFMLIYDVNDFTTFDDVHQWIPSLRCVLNDSVRIVLVGFEDTKDIQISKTLPVSYFDGMNAKNIFKLEAFYEFSDMLGSAVSELIFDAAHIALESKVTTLNSESSELEEKVDYNKNFNALIPNLPIYLM